MASSGFEAPLRESELDSDLWLTQLYKLGTQDWNRAKVIIKSLPFILKLLATDIDITDTKVRACFKVLGIDFEDILSVLMYTGDWNAIEAIVTLLCRADMLSPQLVSQCLNKPTESTVKELQKHRMPMNTKKFDSCLKWAVQHASESGSLLPLDLLLRTAGFSYDKRNIVLDDNGNTLLHIACSHSKGSVVPWLPLWLLGWGIDPNLPNKYGHLPRTMLAEDNQIKSQFDVLSKNDLTKDLALMDCEGVKQFLLQQFCASGRNLDLIDLCTELEKVTKRDYSLVRAALENKRRNTACKALLETVGINIEGLTMLKAVLSKTKSPNEDRGEQFLIKVLDSVIWRLRYESVDVPYTQPLWLRELAGSTTSHEETPGIITLKTVKESIECSTNARYVDTQPTSAPTRYVNVKPSQVRTSRSAENKPEPLQTFEEEICNTLKGLKNAVIYLPHSPSHFVIAASVIREHIPNAVDDNHIKATDKKGKEAQHSDPETSLCSNDTELETVGATVPAFKDSKEELGCKTKDEIPTASKSKFYREQRKKRACRRTRNETFSGEIAEQNTKENKKKHRRRTKSSSDSVRFLKEDMASVSLDLEDEVETVVNTGAKHCGVLVILPTGKTVTTSLATFRALLPKFAVAEHAGTSKSKVGIRKLLRSNDIVLSHVSAVRNCMKSKSLSLAEISLMLFLCVSYNDEVFEMVPSNVRNSPTVVMFFTEFNRSDICTWESVLQYVKCKLSIDVLCFVNDEEMTLMNVLYPNAIYTSNTISSTDMASLVQTLKLHLSTAFGTHGVLEGLIFIMNVSYSTTEFERLLTEAGAQVLPSSLEVKLEQDLSSRKVKQELFVVSTTTSNSRKKAASKSKSYNFSAFITQTRRELCMQTVSLSYLSQKCIDHLRVCQYIKVV